MDSWNSVSIMITYPLLSGRVFMPRFPQEGAFLAQRENRRIRGSIWGSTDLHTTIFRHTSKLPQHSQRQPKQGQNVSLRRTGCQGYVSAVFFVPSHPYLPRYRKKPTHSESPWSTSQWTIHPKENPPKLYNTKCLSAFFQKAAPESASMVRNSEQGLTSRSPPCVRRVVVFGTARGEGAEGQYPLFTSKNEISPPR